MAKYRGAFAVDVDWDNSDYAGSGARTYHYEGCSEQWGTTVGMGGEPLPAHARGGFRIQNTNGIFDFDGTVPTLRQKMGFHRSRVRTTTPISPSTETVTVWDGYGRLANGGIQSGLREVSLESLSLMARVGDLRINQEFGNSTLSAILSAYATAVGMEIDANADIPAVSTGGFQADFSAHEFLQLVAPLANGYVYETHDGKIGVRSHDGASKATTRRVGSTRPILNVTEDDYLIYSNMKYGFPARSIINRMDAHQLIRATTMKTERRQIPLRLSRTGPFRVSGSMSTWDSVGRIMFPDTASRVRLTMVQLVATRTGQTGLGAIVQYTAPGTESTLTSSPFPGTFNVYNAAGSLLTQGDAGTDVSITLASPTSTFTGLNLDATLTVEAEISGPVPDGFNDSIHETYTPNSSASPIAQVSSTIFDECVDTRPPWYRVGATGHLQAEVNRLAEPKNVIEFSMPVNQETPDKAADVLDIRAGDVVNVAAESRGLSSTKCIIGNVRFAHQCASVPRFIFKAQAL